MIIFFQYSFTDVRLFHQESINLINTDLWAFPKANINFARNLGMCVDRKPLNVQGLMSETHLFNSENGLWIYKATKNKKAKIFNLHNHYFFDGKVLSKFEFVFKIYLLGDRKKTGAITEGLIQEILDDILNLNVKIKNLETGKFDNKKLKEIHGYLKKLHICASTKNSKINFQEQELLIAQNQVQIIIALEPHEYLIPTKIKKYKIDTGCYSYYYKKYKLLITSFDYHELNIFQIKEKNRKLRIVNSRFFLEKEGLQNIFKYIYNAVIKIEPKKKPFINDNTLNSKLSDELQIHLINKIKKVSDRQLIENQGIMIEEIYYDEINILKEKIKNFQFRDSVEKTIITYIENQVLIQNLDIMESKYTFKDSQINQVGENNTSYGTIFTQNKALSEESFGIIKDELIRLGKELEERKNIEDNEEIQTAIKTINQTQIAVEEKDTPKVLEYLKSGGKWLLDFAKDIGATIITKLIEQQIGIK